MQSLVRWSPYSLASWPNIWDEEDLLAPVGVSNNLDLYETDDEVVVRANVAGVQPDQVDVMFEKGVLRIRAEAQEEESDKKKQHYSKSSWSYSYRVALPSSVMIDHTVDPKAEVKNGVMSVTFKKAEAGKPKKIAVQS